jgi:hypothetical protein
MKKITFLVLCVLFIYPHNTSSQFLTGFGVKGGITFSNQKHDYTNWLNIENHYVQGFNGSVFGEFLNNKVVNLYSEIGYDQRGYAIPILRTDEFGNPIGEVEFKYKTHYIFVTLGAKLKHASKYFTPYLLFQPRINFYLNYTQKPPEDWPEIESPVLRDFKNVMFDAGIGAGVELNRLLPFKVFFEGSYFPGIITSYSTGYLNVKEYSFNFKIGINFIKDKKKK